MNVVCTGDGQFVEIQGTAEREPFGRDLLTSLLDLGVAGLCRADPDPAGRARPGSPRPVSAGPVRARLAPEGR